MIIKAVFEAEAMAFDAVVESDAATFDPSIEEHGATYSADFEMRTVINNLNVTASIRGGVLYIETTPTTPTGPSRPVPH